MSDVNRDKFYTGGDDEWDDSVEYEVEPPDPEVLAAEERRAQEMIAASKLSVDIQSIYDEAEERHDREYFEDLVRNFRLRFRTKHLLLATTVLAVTIAVAVQTDSGTVLVLGMLLAVGGVTAFLSWRQHQHEQELDRRREQLFAERRRAAQVLRGKNSPKLSAEATSSVDETAPDKADTPGGDMWSATPDEGKKFRLRFSASELAVLVVCAVVLTGLIAAWGLPLTATAIGFITLGGLVLYAVGVEPPYEVIFGWWVLLLLYVLLSIVAALLGGFL